MLTFKDLNKAQILRLILYEISNPNGFSFPSCNHQEILPIQYPSKDV